MLNLRHVLRCRKLFGRWRVFCAAERGQHHENGLAANDSKPARDVAPGERWAFDEHRTHGGSYRRGAAAMSQELGRAKLSKLCAIEGFEDENALFASAMMGSDRCDRLRRRVARPPAS
jgi:hypothetical protein